MARSRLTTLEEDLISDSGSVLWSFVKGEQLEFPVTLSFIQTAMSGYTYEAVVIEAANVANQKKPPTDIQPNGVQTTLNIRIPTFRGTWDPLQAYNTDEVVLYEGLYYAKLKEVNEAVISAISPDFSSKWIKTSLSRIFIQFPETLGATWSIQPTVSVPTYGFFEIRVTELGSAPFKRTWKPIRGMVELQFSPTSVVPDLP